MLKAVVGCLGPGPHGLSSVIEPPDQPPFVEVKHLLSGMAGNAGREVHLQTSPLFPVLLPWLDFSEFKFRQFQKERRAEVIP
jgi:hypothetical protein